MPGDTSAAESPTMRLGMQRIDVSASISIYVQYAHDCEGGWTVYKSTHQDHHVMASIAGMSNISGEDGSRHNDGQSQSQAQVCR
jgi:hypothetical protein